jgi:hypothetical protein
MISARSTDDGGHFSDRYELDGIEYDAKGMRELLAKVKAAQDKEGGEEGEGSADGGMAPLVAMLVKSWSVLRNVRVCQEPGTNARIDGFTMKDLVKKKLLELKGPGGNLLGKDVFYTIDKREVPDRHWPVVCDVLTQFGFEDIDAEDLSARCARIPADLCEDFDSRVVTPWQSAWRGFRATQRQGRGGDAEQVEQDTCTAPGPSSVATKQETLPSGDCLFQWGAFEIVMYIVSRRGVRTTAGTFRIGCIDWTASALTAPPKGKKNDRESFVVAAPDQLVRLEIAVYL